MIFSLQHQKYRFKYSCTDHASLPVDSKINPLTAACWRIEFSLGVCGDWRRLVLQSLAEVIMTLKLVLNTWSFAYLSVFNNCRSSETVMLVCLPVFACLQPILIAGITLLLFASLPLPFSLTLFLVVMVFSPLISLTIYAPKGQWWLLVMTLNQAVVYGVIVLKMHFST